MATTENLQSIFKEVQALYKEAFNEEISIKEVEDIFNSQFELAKDAMPNLENIEFLYLGKLLYNEPKHKALSNKKESTYFGTYA